MLSAIAAGADVGSIAVRNIAFHVFILHRNGSENSERTTIVKNVPSNVAASQAERPWRAAARALFQSALVAAPRTDDYEPRH